MVCDRCVLVVRQLLDQLELGYKNIQMGQVELTEEPTIVKLDSFRTSLLTTGFELLDDKKAKLVEQIKNTIISLVQGYGEEEFNKKLSAILEEKLQV